MSKVTDPRYQNPDNDPLGPYVLADVTSPINRPSLGYEFHGRLPPEGRTWRYSSERMGELEAEGRIVVSRSGMPRMKRYLSEARPPEEPTDEEDNTPPAIGVDYVVRAMMRSLVRVVARNPSELQRVEWRDLERLLREVLEGLGFGTHLTPPAKDGGFDLEVSCVEHGVKVVYLVEVKHWVKGSKRPGMDVVSSLFDVVVRRGGVSGGVILSSSGFTQATRRGRTEVQQQMIRLGGRGKIISLCQSYVESEDGLWEPTTSLADVLVEGTF